MPIPINFTAKTDREILMQIATTTNHINEHLVELNGTVANLQRHSIDHDIRLTKLETGDRVTEKVLQLTPKQGIIAAVIAGAIGLLQLGAMVGWW